MNRRTGTSPAPYAWLMVALFGSLPFFSVRALTGGYSLTLLVLVTIFVFNIRFLRNINRLEMAHFLFIGLAAVSLTLTLHHGAVTAWIKSFIYFTTFMALRRYASSLGLQRTVNSAILGTQVGLVLYLLLVVVALQYSGLLSSIFNNINYWSFTYRIQRSIAILTGAENFFASGVMRSTMGEVFALSCLLPIVFARSRGLNKVDLITVFVGFLLVIATFSRRAMVVVALITILSSGSLKWQIRAVMGVGFISLMFFLFVLVGIENRFSVIDESARLYQSENAIYGFANNIITGVGYGARLPIEPYGEPYHIHNFVLANGYMMGVIGLVFSMYMFWQIGIKMVRVRRAPYMALLIIPLVGMMVGSTVEGIYTPVAWIVMALCFSQYHVETNGEYPNS